MLELVSTVEGTIEFRIFGYQIFFLKSEKREGAATSSQGQPSPAGRRSRKPAVGFLIF